MKIDKSMEIIHNSWLCVDIQPSSHQVLEFWSSAAEAAACKCAAAGLSPAFRGVPDYAPRCTWSHANALLGKRKTLGLKPSYIFFLFSVWPSHLTQNLKGWGRPWETLPLNNFLSLTAPVCAILLEWRSAWVLAMLFSECDVLPQPQRSPPSAAEFLFWGPAGTLFVMFFLLGVSWAFLVSPGRFCVSLGSQGCSKWVKKLLKINPK